MSPPLDPRLARNESLKQDEKIDEKIQEFLFKLYQKEFPLQQILEVDREIIRLTDDLNSAKERGA